MSTYSEQQAAKHRRIVSLFTCINQKLTFVWKQQIEKHSKDPPWWIGRLYLAG